MNLCNFYRTVDNHVRMRTQIFFRGEEGGYDNVILLFK